MAKPVFMSAVALAAFLAGLAPASAEAPQIQAARAAVKATLRDPGSAQFSEVAAKPGAVCGWVNARNGFGGYGGRLLFVYVTASRRAFVLDPSSSAGADFAHDAVEAYERFCL